MGQHLQRLVQILIPSLILILWMKVAPLMKIGEDSDSMNENVENTATKDMNVQEW